MNYDLPNPPPQRFAIVAACAWLSGATAGMAAVGAGVATLLGHGEQAISAVIAFAICGGFGLLTYGLCWLLERHTPAGVAYGFMVGMLLRLVGCLVAVGIGWSLGAPKSFTYWMAGAYMAVLVVEVALIGKYVATLSLPSVQSTATLENNG